MKTITFNQTMNLEVTFEVEIPDDWNSDDVDDLVRNMESNLTVVANEGDGYRVVSESLDCAEIVSAQLLENAE